MIPADGYGYWLPLMKNYLDICNGVEINCWNEEQKAINEIKLEFQHFMVDVKELETYFRGELTEQVKRFFLENYLDEYGRIKWFTILLKKNDKHYFNSEHWGTEFHAWEVEGKDVQFIKSVMPQEISFHEIK